MEHRKPAVRWGTSAAFAAAATVVGYAYFLQPAAWPGRLKLAAACLLAAAAAAAAAWAWLRTIPPCLAALTPRTAIFCVLLGLLCGLGLVVVTPIPPARGLPPEHPLKAILVGRQSVLYVLAGWCMGGPIAVAWLWLVSREASLAGGVGGRGFQPAGGSAAGPVVPVLRRIVARCAWLGYALPLLAAGGTYLAIFWPALMSNDSLGQWSQVVTGHYSDLAPAFHTMTNWLITRIWLSPAAVALAQLLALSLVVAWSLKRLRQWGMPRGLAWTTCGVMALLPATGILAITLWKDIPYSICMLLLSLWVMEMIHSRGAWLSRRCSWMLLGVVLGLVALYRHNGLPVALGTPILLAIPYCRYWRRLALALAVAGAVIWGVRGPLYRKLGVASGHDVFQVALCIQHIAAHTAGGTPLTPAEQVLLDGLYPLKDGRWPYSPSQIDGGMNIDELNSWPKWDAKKKDLTALTLRLFWRRPAVNLRHVLASSSYIWGIAGPRDAHYYIVAFAEGPPLRYQVLRGVQDDGQVVFEWVEPRLPLPRIVAQTFRQKWLFWRAAIYLYLILLSTGIAMLRSRSPRYGLLLLPLLLHSGLLAAVCLSPEFRFQFPVYLVTVLYSGFLLFCVPRAAAGRTPAGCPVHGSDAGLPAGAVPNG
jgi:hypothetical protein